MNKQQIIDLCRAAGQIGDVTHEEFAEYVIPINNRKRVDGEWKNVEMPYMQVDGRVAMARTDHRRQGKKLDILPTQIVIDNDDILTVQVTIESEVYGKSTGLATSKKTNQNAEGQFPFEVAETSAIGRALALYGYGVFPGTGLTSAEDMRRVNERSFSQGESDKKNEKSSQNGASQTTQAAQNVKTGECPAHHTPTVWFEKQQKWAHKIEGTKDWCYETPKG